MGSTSSEVLEKPVALVYLTVQSTPRNMDIMSVGRVFRWAVRVLFLSAGVGLAAAALLLLLLWREHRTEIALPAPTGPFPVGRTTAAWTNDAQSDLLSPPPGQKRRVLVWIWYPAVSSPSKTADYQPDAWRIALKRASGVLMSDFLTRDAAVVHTHSTANAAVSPNQRAYPIVILRPGGGALTTDFTTLAEDLASYGYVVVGFDAPHRTTVVVLPDGSVVTRPASANPEDMPPADQQRLIEKLLPLWVDDTKFVVDQLVHLNAGDPSGRFTGRLDLQRLGMYGHSFGGATALQFCHEDARCKAAMDIDGNPYGSVVQQGLKQPVLFLLSDHGDLSSPDEREVMDKIKSIRDHAPAGSMLLTLRGANHFSFSDQILLKSHFVIATINAVHRGLDPGRGIAITRAWVHTFFDVNLKNAPVRLFNGLRRQYPEATDARL